MLGPDFSIFLERYDAVYINIAKVASSSLKATFASLLDLDLDAVDGNPHEVGVNKSSAGHTGDTEMHIFQRFLIVVEKWGIRSGCQH